MTGVVALEISEDDRSMADALLGAAGQVVWFDDEAKLDAVTALSGSGPAYVFYMVEAMAVAGMRQGLDPNQAMHAGAANGDRRGGADGSRFHSVSVLRENVTSPKGTTAAALGGADGAPTGSKIDGPGGRGSAA